ncbi:hypothetical protein [Desulfitibacter alkalitolerans]|uniref:hypothetical protein n=1 Tax=Desulfitibacter alkalitolerans TaxID=264641 RepID=UPI00048631EE|nr:hypothetical protein [Desulfitibacter alkalitolerans]
MTNFVVIIAATIMVFVLFTWFLGKIFKSNRFFKFIPSFVALFVAVYNIYIANISPGDFENLARGLLAIILLAGAVSGVITAFIIDHFMPYFARKTR